MGSSARLPPHLDNQIGALVYSMIGEPSQEAQIRYQLQLAHNSLRDLHAQLETLQHKCHGFEYKFAKAKEEAALNAGALRRTVGEYDALKAKFEQLSKECELYRNDREIFAEAAEDAEERRAEAERRAAEAEQRADEANQRQNAAIRFVEDLLRVSPSGKTSIHAAAEHNGSPTTNIVTESADSSRSPGSNEAPEAQNPSVADYTYRRLPSSLQREPRGAKRSLFEACKSPEINNCILRRRTGNCVLERSKSAGDKVSRIHSLSENEKENIDLMDFTEAEAGVNIEQAAQSENPVVRRLADLIKIAKKNLVKAEEEGDLIHAKYCELHKLLMDTLHTFGIVPELT